jgi:hypothetical protein
MREQIYDIIQKNLSEMNKHFRYDNNRLYIGDKCFFVERVFSMKYKMSGFRLIFYNEQRIIIAKIFLREHDFMLEQIISSFIYELIFLGLLLDESVYKYYIIN